MIKEDHVHLGDCVAYLRRAEAPFADLVFADPPFNIGYDYDHYEDQVAYGEYVDWSRTWVAACVDVLKPHGSLYIAIGDEYAAEIRTIGRELGLTLRNWIVWHYTFGQNMKSKFSRSHAHIFYFVRDPKNFVFNDRRVRVPSARHTEYSDKRADPWGRIPDDTWDEFPRVCGTFKERQGWHGCQMPEALLMRIIRASSNEGDVVLDPFAGSGTTLVAAKKLGRRFVGCDVSKTYVAEARRRLATADVPPGDAPPSRPIHGVRDEALDGAGVRARRGTKSSRSSNGNAAELDLFGQEAPSRPIHGARGYDGIVAAAQGGRSPRRRRRSANGHPTPAWPDLHVQTLCSLYRETNTARFRLAPNAVAMDCFTRLLNERLTAPGDAQSAAYSAADVLAMLEHLDRAGQLPRLRNDRAYTRRHHDAPREAAVDD